MLGGQWPRQACQAWANGVNARYAIRSIVSPFHPIPCPIGQNNLVDEKCNLYFHGMVSLWDLKPYGLITVTFFLLADLIYDFLLPCK